MMDGRVKTLHPAVHGGLLALRDEPAHVAAMEAHGIAPIDLLVVNLYPFEATWRRAAAATPTASRTSTSAARRCCAPRPRTTPMSRWSRMSRTTTRCWPRSTRTAAPRRAFRKRLALTAYARTAAYDAAVSAWLAEALDETPRRRAFAGALAQPLRYGENPHQRAAFYTDGSGRPGVATARQLQGKELSYNNINDTDAAFELVAEFERAPPASSSSTPIPAAWPRAATSRRPMRAPSTATGSRPSAASSR